MGLIRGFGKVVVFTTERINGVANRFAKHCESAEEKIADFRDVVELKIRILQIEKKISKLEEEKFQYTSELGELVANPPIHGVELFYMEEYMEKYKELVGMIGLYNEEIEPYRMALAEYVFLLNIGNDDFYVDIIFSDEEE